MTLGAVVVYVYLSFWRETKSNGHEAFSKGDEYFISKRQLCEITGIPKAADAISELYQSFQFIGGVHLLSSKINGQIQFHEMGEGFVILKRMKALKKMQTAFYRKIKDLQMAAKPEPEKTVPTKKKSMTK